MDNFLSNIESTISGSGIFANEHQVQCITELFELAAEELEGASYEQQQHLFRLSHDNYGVFVVIVQFLEYLPPALRYSLVSKVMYNFGMCEAPASCVNQMAELMQGEQRSWWSVPETQDSIYGLRELLLADSTVGIDPLVGEFNHCGDISLIYAMLTNPLLPKSFSERIVRREHLIFEKADEDDLVLLTALAQENLAP